MNIYKLNKANELIEAISVIEKLEKSFAKNNWIKISTPAYKDGLNIPNVLWSDLRLFLSQKANEYHQMFDEL